MLELLGGWTASGIGGANEGGQPEPVTKWLGSIIGWPVQMVPSLPPPAPWIKGTDTPGKQDEEPDTSDDTPPMPGFPKSGVTS